MHACIIIKQCGGKNIIIQRLSAFLEIISYLSIGSLSSCIRDCKRRQCLFSSMGSHENAYDEFFVPRSASIYFYAEVY